MTDGARHPSRRILAAMAAPAAVVLALLGVYIAGYGVFDETFLRVGVYALAALVLILQGAERRFAEAPRSRWLWLVDAALFACLAVSTWRYFAIGEELEIGLYYFTT